MPNAEAVETVFLDQSTGIIAGCNTDDCKLFLETSTIEASVSLSVLERLRAAAPRTEFLDSPVSGGIPPAHAGTLTFMVGGPKAVFEKARPIMATMGKPENLIHCGGPGAGLATKQINNYIAYCSYVALCEGEESSQGVTVAFMTDASTGMNTGIKFGLDPKTLNGRPSISFKCLMLVVLMI